MARQDALETSFLYGGNAAYIEELQAAYARDPTSVDPEWQTFFRSLDEDKGAGREERRRRLVGEAELADPRQRRDRLGARRQLGHRREGDRREDPRQVRHRRRRPAKGASSPPPPGISVEQATKDSVRAIMLIRAYRMRGHLHAKLDPLGLAPRGDHEELHPQHYGFEEKDWDRPIFLDNVLGLEFSTIREIVEILERTYCQTLGVEFMHISNPGGEGVDPGAHRGQGQGDLLHARGPSRDPQQADRGGGLREVPRPQVHRHQALRPRRLGGDDPGARADHQARRRARRARRSCSAWPIAAGSTCSPT